MAKAIALFLFLGSMVSASFAQGISVSPSRLFFKGLPGETVTQVITFSNTSKTEMNFISSIKDWNRDSTGLKQYYPGGQLSSSNAKWLALSSNSVSLAPGETKEINLNLKIPNDSTSNRLSNSMLFFTQVKAQKSSARTANMGVDILFEMGIQVYHIPEGLSAGELEFLAFEERSQTNSADTTRKMAVKIKNTGSINKDAYVRFELTNTSSGEEIQMKPVAIAMLPNAEQWVNLNLPAKLKGKYLVVAILDAGSQYDLKVAEKEITY
ncbi:hypothetical protein [Pedobacter sp. GR22-6]|uniref:hypothetical protein n=1 Tax=Pedobacter sp. GR22-6 TaxID=3127957 RepID=UPI00307F834C